MRHRHTLWAIVFLLLMAGLSWLMRTGGVLMFLPALPQPYTLYALYGLFAVAALLITAWFCKRDGLSLRQLGIGVDRNNRRDFVWGLLIAIALWGAMALVMTVTAGIRWQWHPEFLFPNLIIGLVFIFVADLGTEVAYRGYGLTRLSQGIGPWPAILCIAVFVGLQAYSPGRQESMQVYAMLIPALHAVFFALLYLYTGRLGASVGLHTGGNLASISLFDFDGNVPGQLIPAGVFQPGETVMTNSAHAIQLPFVITALLIILALVLLWRRRPMVALSQN